VATISRYPDWQQSETDSCWLAKKNKHVSANAQPNRTSMPTSLQIDTEMKPSVPEDR
jgi:hypothetical protein